MSVQMIGDADVVALRPELMPGTMPGPEPMPGTAPGVINPLEPAAGPDGTRFPLQSHASLVRALFLAVFDTCAPFPQVLSAGILRSYERAGWNLITDEPADPGISPVYPTLGDLETAAASVVDDAGYGREDGDVRALVSGRICAVAPGSGDDRESAFHAGVLLIRVIEYLRLRQLPPGDRPGPMRPAAEMFTRLLADIRACGEETKPRDSGFS